MAPDAPSDESHNLQKDDSEGINENAAGDSKT